MPLAEVYLDALLILVSQIVLMMARVNREGWGMEREAVREGIHPSADIEREVDINILDLV